MNMKFPVPGTGGDRYVPYEERTGEESVVFFTRDLSEEGLKKIYDRVSSVLEGKVAVKLHTGEAEGPNIIPRPWVKELLASRLPEAAIVETNTRYGITLYDYIVRDASSVREESILYSRHSNVNE